MRFFRSVVRLAATSIALCCIANTNIVAQEIILRSGAPGRIQGVVFDSLRGVVVQGATVLLVGRSEADTTDRYGRYDFRDVAPGKQLVAFNWPNLDSLGLGTMGREITVDGGLTTKADLASPSFRTVWMHHCGNAEKFSADSGIAYGTMRDARTLLPVAGGTVRFSWFDFDTTLIAKAYVKDVEHTATADKSGAYVACGMPADIRVTATARGAGAATGEFNFEVSALRLQRMDLLVSADMVIPDSVHFVSMADSFAAQRPRGRATIRGVVLDYRRKPMAGATVSIAAVDTVVRTGKNGQFNLGDLPSGTHELGIRRVGYAPYQALVNLRPDSISDVRVQMPDISMMTAVNVRASRDKSSYRSDYERRRRLGYGYYFDPLKVANLGDLGTVLSLAPDVTIRRSPGGAVLALIPAAESPFCAMTVFVDGMLTNWARVNVYAPKHFRSIEVYPDWRKVPREFKDMVPGNWPCGAAVFWTYGVKW